jgi:hypothetical protein
VALLEKKYTSDVGGVVKTRFINGTTPVLVVGFLTRKSENILGSNGIRKCKKLIMGQKPR